MISARAWMVGMVVSVAACSGGDKSDGLGESYTALRNNDGALCGFPCDDGDVCYCDAGDYCEDEDAHICRLTANSSEITPGPTSQKV